MTNRIFKVSFTVVLLLIMFSGLVHSQTVISSPYSRYGLGKLQNSNQAYTMSMGGVGYGIRNSSIINFSNPASYNCADTLSFVFETGVYSNFSVMKTKELSQNRNYTSLSYLLFGFPVTKWWGVGLGVLPYSNVGYKISDEQTIANVGRTDFTYEGSGGLNKVFIGNSFKPFKNFSIGFNASYVFGALVKTRTVNFPDSVSFFNYKIKNNTNVGDFSFNYGLQYILPLKKGNSLNFGLVFSNSQKMGASKDELGIRFLPQTGGGIIVKDTVAFTSDLSGDIVIPTSIGGGIVFKRTEKLLIGADVNWQNWSKYTSFGESDSLKNSMDFAFGGQFIPNSTSSSSYFKKMAYRLGVRYGQTYLQIKNSQLTEYAVSFGFTFPLRKTRTTVNLAFELGEMGTYENNLHKEQFGRVMLTFNIKERWFIKPKFD
ncbi:MAG: hypothetical protein HXX09_01625 [Bacteroidetes bacterium]|nr:hypothetical protein [Bacteroidota bacterium]